MVTNEWLIGFCHILSESKNKRPFRTFITWPLAPHKADLHVCKPFSTPSTSAFSAPSTSAFLHPLPLRPPPGPSDPPRAPSNRWRPVHPRGTPPRPAHCARVRRGRSRRPSGARAWRANDPRRDAAGLTVPPWERHGASRMIAGGSMAQAIFEYEMTWRSADVYQCALSSTVPSASCPPMTRICPFTPQAQQPQRGVGIAGRRRHFRTEGSKASTTSSTCLSWAPASARCLQKLHEPWKSTNGVFFRKQTLSL